MSVQVHRRQSTCCRAKKQKLPAKRLLPSLLPEGLRFLDMQHVAVRVVAIGGMTHSPGYFMQTLIGMPSEKGRRPGRKYRRTGFHIRRA